MPGMTPMNITLTRAVGASLKVSRKGDTLILNGVAIDLSAATADAPIPMGGSDWIVSDVTRDDDGLHLKIIAPYGGDDLPEALWYPAPLIVTRNGPVTLPAWQVGAAIL